MQLPGAGCDNERKAYDDINTSQPETFSVEPNAFLVRMIASRKPGNALDAGMGQGRNAIWTRLAIRLAELPSPLLLVVDVLVDEHAVSF